MVAAFALGKHDVVKLAVQDSSFSRMNPLDCLIFAPCMRKIIVPFLLLTALVLMVTLTGCDPYRKLAKSDAIADKDSAAMAYYNHKKYDQAVYIFEELMAVYRGHPRMEEMYYYYAYCKYFMGELVTAAFYFDDYSQKYPSSKHAEEFEFMTAKCYYQISDPYYLDQKYTEKAINQFQLFLSRHPDTRHKEKSMEYLTELRERLAKKAFEQAKLYHKIGKHKAGVEAFKVMINQYPDSKFREESQFLLLKSAVDLAASSITTKRLDRYNEAMEFHEKFVEKFPSSKFADEAANLRAEIERNQKKLLEEKAKDEEKAAFEAFRRSITAVMDASDESIRKEEYGKSLDAYRSFQEKYPSSTYLDDADRLFQAYEEKFKE
jgi:outer membrane protein assembly factor BamD